MHRSLSIIIRTSLAALVLAAAALTAVLGASTLTGRSPTHSAGDGFVWPSVTATVDGSH